MCGANDIDRVNFLGLVVVLLSSCCLQVPDVGVAAASAGPDVGYSVPVAQKGLVQKGLVQKGSAQKGSAQKGLAQRSGDSQMASAGVHPPGVARKRVGRPRKADAEVGVAPGCERCFVS